MLNTKNCQQIIIIKTFYYTCNNII